MNQYKVLDIIGHVSTLLCSPKAKLKLLWEGVVWAGPMDYRPNVPCACLLERILPNTIW